MPPLTQEERTAARFFENIVLGAHPEVETFSITRITPKNRRVWLTKAGPDDRWAVAVEEGGFFAYGATLDKAIDAALTKATVLT